VVGLAPFVYEDLITQIQTRTADAGLAGSGDIDTLAAESARLRIATDQLLAGQ
jgi:hypothetical protein